MSKVLFGEVPFAGRLLHVVETQHKEGEGVGDFMRQVISAALYTKEELQFLLESAKAQKESASLINCIQRELDLHA